MSDFRCEDWCLDSNHTFKLDIVNPLGSKVGTQLEDIDLDFSKAFNTVNHGILLNKFYIYGVRGIILIFFRFYLKNRKLNVSIGDYCSSFYDLDI